MNKYLIPVFVIFVFILSSSCRRNLDEVNTNTGNVQNMQDLKVPIDFDWETGIEIEVVVNLHSTKAYQPKHRISILKGDKQTDGLLSSGAITVGQTYTDKISLPAYTQELTLLCEDPFGAVLTETVPIEGNIVSHTFSFEKETQVKSSPRFKSTAEGPDCDEGCDELISGGGTINISGGLTYCIAEDFDGKINFQNWNGGGTLRICGTAKITNNQYLESNSHIVVAEGGYLHLNKNIQLAGASITIFGDADVLLGAIDFGNNSAFTVYENAIVQVKKFKGWAFDATLENSGTITTLQDSYHNGPVTNFGSMTYNGNFEFDGSTFYNGNFISIGKKCLCYSTSGTMENNGEMQVVKDFEIGNGLVFTNNGIVNTNDAFDSYNSSSVINNGTITAKDDCEIGTNGDFTNNCYFETTKDINFTNNVNITLNTGYLKAGKEINFWNSTSVNLNDYCMVSAEDCEMECSINGTNGVSTFLVTDDLSIWSNQDKFNGTIEVVTETGNLNAGGEANFTDGAYYTSIANAVNYLPITSCNPEGFGTPTIVDMDFDGVPNNLDEFPEDPQRAFISYFPDDIEYATVAFEDLWPAKGDYDFNDLVVAIYGSEVTNADDQLVDINFNFVVLAVGASLDNGFAFQLESITPDMVASVSGSVLESGYAIISANGLEADQPKAVVIVTESVNDVIHRPGGSFFNTVEGNQQGTSDTIQIAITLSEPIDRQMFGMDVFNPFIIKNQNRDIEIHLANFPPTNLMDTDLFGTGNDASNPVAGIYYTTTTNLPWGLLLLEPFDYPKEQSKIIEAYNHFDSWVETGGSNYSDWYLDFSGYRNVSDIY